MVVSLGHQNSPSGSLGRDPNFEPSAMMVGLFDWIKELSRPVKKFPLYIDGDICRIYWHVGQSICSVILNTHPALTHGGNILLSCLS